jgi:hypothetical protein
MSHTWTWDEINNDWLLGSRLALPPDDVVAAFNRVEQILGGDWIEASRIHTGVQVRGTQSTLSVATVGQLIASLDGIPGAAELIEKLRGDDASAFAELTAVHLIRSGEPGAIIELGPIVQVGERNRKPDFRIRQGDEPWIYVEITQPDVAEAQNRVLAIMDRIATLLQPIKRAFALEVFLRHEPTENEENALAEAVQQFCVLDGPQSKDLPGLAILTLNASAPGVVVALDHPGEPNVPRLGLAKTLVGPDEPHRHIAVRMAYADDRAEDFLRKEAKQLPTDSPGLIMVQMSRAPGGIKSWEPILRRRFQPNLHTRVSAVCLFRSGHELTPDGEAWIPKAKVILNPHARLPLPSWITDGLSRAAPAPNP